MFRFRYAAAAGATVLAGGLVAGVLTVAPSAFASVAGGNPQPTCTVQPTGGGYGDCHTTKPAPTPTETITTPPPVVTPQVAQEDFELDLSTVNPNGVVDATGPVRFHDGTDVSVSDILDRFQQGGNSVTVRHEALGGVAIDLRTCTITLDQNDLPWWFTGGTGRDFLARGFGYYTLRGAFSFPTRDFRCTLPVGLTVGQATWDLNNGGGNLPAPVFYDIFVQATGWASVRPHIFISPAPKPTPSVTYSY